MHAHTDPGRVVRAPRGWIPNARGRAIEDVVVSVCARTQGNGRALEHAEFSDASRDPKVRPVTDEARAALALLTACACWFASLGIMRQTFGAMSSKVSLGVAAAVGALLPFVPDLVKLVSLPAPVSNALCAVVLAVAYKLVPKRDEPKS